jgi:hypothetical protein
MAYMPDASSRIEVSKVRKGSKRVAAREKAC